MSRNARVGENGETSPTFDVYLMTKQKGPLTVANLVKMANSRQCLANVPIRWLRVPYEALCKLLHCWELLRSFARSKIKV